MSISRRVEGRSSSCTLPRKFSEGVELLARLQRRQIFKQVADRLHVQRRGGGFVGVDAVILLLLAFTRTMFEGGIRGFCADVADYSEHLGRIAGRSSLMGSSALSKLPAAVKVEDLAEFGRWFLLEGSGAASILHNPAFLPRNARGEPCHVFWYDPTREAFRQRRLEEHPDRPRSKRRAAASGKPGHKGRKRGEIVSSVGMLQHVSGIWLDATLVVGNGAPREQFASAIKTVARTCAHLKHPLRRSLIVGDGEFADLPYLDIAHRAGVPLLSRCSRYKLLESPHVLHLLAQAEWRPVPSGGTGPQRWACDLGIVELPPGEGTRGPNGEVYAPIPARIVVTRRADDGRVGKLVGGERLELFVALGVLSEEWPAEDLVAAFFARSAIENSFSAIDEETEMDRTVSYQPGGQLLAVLCAAFVWNDRLVRGFSAAKQPTATHARLPLAGRVTPPPPLDVGSLPSEPPVIEAAKAVPPPPTNSTADPLDEALAKCNIVNQVARRKLTWDASTRILTNAHGEEFHFAHADLSPRDSGLRFVSRTQRKLITVAIARPAVEGVRQALATGRPPRTERRPHVRPHEWPITALPPRPPDTAPPEWPLHDPTSARRAAVQSALKLVVRAAFVVTAPEPAGTHDGLFYRSIRHRRHGRMTWAEQTACQAATTAATVRTRKTA